MERDFLGKINISKLGFGGWPIGKCQVYDDMSDEEAFKALDCYFEHGGNFVDTAQGYQQSEAVIGKYLKQSDNKNKIILATKTNCGRNMETVSEIEEKLDESLKKLGREYVDLFYFHAPAEDDQVIAEAFGVMENLKKKGKIRSIGASIKGPDVTDETVKLCKKYIDTTSIDVIQIVYSILRQQNGEIFDYAAQNNVALVGRTSLETGFLSGRYKKGFRFEERDHRSRWNSHYDDICEYVEMIEKEFIGKYDDKLTSLALRFAMYPQSITSTIVGVKNMAQMKEISEFAKRERLPEEAYQKLQKMFQGKTALFNI